MEWKEKVLESAVQIRVVAGDLSVRRGRDAPIDVNQTARANRVAFDRWLVQPLGAVIDIGSMRDIRSFLDQQDVQIMPMMVVDERFHPRPDFIIIKYRTHRFISNLGRNWTTRGSDTEDCRLGVHHCSRSISGSYGPKDERGGKTEKGIIIFHPRRFKNHKLCLHCKNNSICIPTIPVVDCMLGV